RGFFRGAAFDISGHVFHPHQLQQAPREQETVARLQSRNKTFLDTAQLLAAAALAPELQLNARIADDGADAHAMSPRQPRIRYTPDAKLVRLDPAIIRIGCQGKP